MKYSKNNPPFVCMLTNSQCYKETTTMQIKGVLIHSTGCNNTALARYAQPSDNDPNKDQILKVIGTNRYHNDYNHIVLPDYAKAGLNGFIGTNANGEVMALQAMPWNYRPWGCGSGPKGSMNSGWIQFEICESDLNDSSYFYKIYNETIELVAYLCKLYNLDPLGTTDYNAYVRNVPIITCHADSCKLGLGSNHGDILHWFPKYGKTMDVIRKDVAALIKESETPVVVPEVPQGGKTKVTQAEFNAMLQNYFASLKAQPATWEQEAIDWAHKMGLMNGDESGNLAPKHFITRGEVASVLKRFYETT